MKIHIILWFKIIISIYVNIIIDHFSAKTVFRRQKLSSIESDSASKDVSRAERIKAIILAVDP